MKFHIVRNQETAKEILNTYSLTLNELKEYNRHVRDWNKLIPGTKLKIPIINEAVEQDIIDMEPFIEDYYPRNTSPFYEKDQIWNHRLRRHCREPHCQRGICLRHQTFFPFEKGSADCRL